MQVGPEDDRIRLRELCIRPGVQGRQVARVASLYPQSSGVVCGVVRTFCDTHADARHELVTRQVRQVRLQQRILVYFPECPF